MRLAGKSLAGRNARWSATILPGPMRGLVAAQSGIATSDRALGSLGAVVQWRPAGGHRLAAEWHRERSEATSNTVYLLRYQFLFTRRLL